MAGKNSGSPKSGPRPAPSPPPVRGGGGGAAKLILYPLAIAGGLYMGVQAYPALKDRLPQMNRRAGKAPAEAPEETQPLTRTHSRRKRRRHHRETTQVQTVKAETTSSEDEQKDPASEKRKQPADVGSASEAPKPEPGTVDVEEPPVKTEEPHVEVRPATPGEAPASKAPQPLGKSPGPQSLQAPPARPVAPREIDRGPGRRREVALTFDAGSDYHPVADILNALRDEGVKATFFLTGEWVRRNPLTTRRIVAEGHEVGNHSWSHAAFTSLSDEEIRDQLNRTEAIIRQTVGRGTHPYFRPPLGARSRHVLEVLGSEGFMSIYWTLDSRDSVDKGITAEQIRERVAGNVQPGTIVLMHCGSRPTADALPDILRALRQKGLAQVPIGRLLAE